MAHHPTWFKYGPTIEDHWGPALQTLESDIEVDLVTFSYDGRYLASAALNATTILLWNTLTGTLRSKLEGHRGELRSIMFSRNGHLASISDSCEIRVWDPVTGAIFHKVDTGIEISCSVWVEWPAAFAPDGTLAFSSGDWLGDRRTDWRVWIWIPNAGVRSVQMKIQAIVRGLAFLSNGDLALALSFDTNKQDSATTAPLKGEILIYNLENQAQRRITCAGFSHASFSSSDQVALRLEGGHSGLVVYNLTTGITYKYDISLEHLSFSGNKYIIAADGEGSLYRFNLQSRTNNFIGTCRGYIVIIATSSDGKLAFIGQPSKAIRLWDSVPAPAFRDDDRAVIPASDRLSVMWNPSTRGSHFRPNDEGDRIEAMAFSHDGRCFASVSFFGTLKIWDTITNEARTLRSSGLRLETVTFSTSGRYLAFGGDSTVVEVCDSASGRLLAALDDGEGRGITAVTFSPNDEILVSGSYDGIMRFWDSKTRGLQRTHRLDNPIKSISFSQNGRRIACLTKHRGLGIQIWDAEQYTCLQSIPINFEPNHNFGQISMSFSADESYLDTDLGLVQLQPSLNRLPSKVYMPDKRWQFEHNWLLYDGQRSLWLPPDYRPLCIARHDNLLVMSHQSGKMSFFEGNTHDSTLDPEYEATTQKKTKKPKESARDTLRHWFKGKGRSKQ